MAFCVVYCTAGFVEMCFSCECAQCPLHLRLQGRLFSYPDTHRHRLGANYLQIPVNCPFRARVANYQRDGPMSILDNQGKPTTLGSHCEGRGHGGGSGAGAAGWWFSVWPPGPPALCGKGFHRRFCQPHTFCPTTQVLPVRGLSVPIV